MPYRRLLLAVICLLSFGRVFAADDLGTYQNYTNNVENYCQLQKPGIPKVSTLWNGWEQDNIIGIEKVPYADIASKWGDDKYKSYLRTIGSDPSKIDTIELTMPSPNALQKASYVYTETMGALYACAVLDAKKRVINGLLPQVKGQSNMKRDFEKQVQSVMAEMQKRHCRDLSDTTDNKNLSIKKALLDNTMYQYCAYRYYLHYLDYNAKNSANTFFKNAKSGSWLALLRTTEQTAAYIQKQSSAVTDEIAHIREIYPQAFVAYTEFERTYGAHILLMFILQDYIEMRDTLKQLMNPIGQVIKKASNAQSPGSGVK